MERLTRSVIPRSVSMFRWERPLNRSRSVWILSSFGLSSFALQQASRHAFSAGFLQLAGRIDAAQIAVHQYFKENPGFGRRFSSLRRIGAVQFPVIQFLKLGADKPYRILLWYRNFHIHRKRQLLKFPLKSVMLYRQSGRPRSCHVSSGRQRVGRLTC